MKRQLHKLFTDILPLLAFILVGACYELSEETKSLIAKAEQGEAVAQTNWGAMYYRGNGVHQDDVKAYAWISVSSATGHENASANRDEIAKNMTPDQIDEGQKLAREWFEKYHSKE